MIKKHESLLSFINIIRSISLTAITASSTYAFIVVILFFFFYKFGVDVIYTDNLLYIKCTYAHNISVFTLLIV